MSKIAVPAFSNAMQFMKQEWRGVMLLALKTYLLIFLFQIVASIPVHIIMGPQLATTMQANPMSLSEIPQSLILMNIITGIIGYLLTQWIVSPLYIAISRSVVLGETFDRVLCKHLTEARTVRVAKLLWTVLIFMLPLYAAIFPISMFLLPKQAGGFDLPSAVLVSSLLIAFLAYMVFLFYINLRIFYLVPAIATDRPFSSIWEIWEHSKGHAWSVCKVVLLGMLLIIGVAILFILGILIFSAILSAIAQVTMAGKLVIQIFVGILIVLSILAMLAVLVLYIPQLITAAVASVYKLSQSKAK